MEPSVTMLMGGASACQDIQEICVKKSAHTGPMARTARRPASVRMMGSVTWLMVAASALLAGREHFVRRGFVSESMSMVLIAR